MSIELSRSFNADWINAVLNDASVKDAAEIKGIGDVSALVENVNNVLLQNDFGGFIYVQVAKGTYEVHTQFLKEGRGMRALKAAIASVRWMFINTDCMRILSKAKPDNTGACQLAERVLGKQRFNGTYNYYEMDYMQWVETDCSAQIRGVAFHELIADKTNHFDDDVHNFHVGAALQLCEAGNPIKAIQVYNYWALASGYAMAAINTLNPLIISVGDMKFTFPLEVI